MAIPFAHHPPPPPNGSLRDRTCPTDRRESRLSFNAPPPPHLPPPHTFPPSPLLLSPKKSGKRSTNMLEKFPLSRVEYTHYSTSAVIFSAFSAVSVLATHVTRYINGKKSSKFVSDQRWFAVQCTTFYFVIFEEIFEAVWRKSAKRHSGQKIRQVGSLLVTEALRIMVLALLYVQKKYSVSTKKCNYTHL
jgi:hypothetical protein